MRPPSRTCSTWAPAHSPTWSLPLAARSAPDHLRLDGQYARVLAVTAYPRTIAAGWLEALIDSDLPVELSLHVRPLPSAAVVRALGHQLVQLQASRLLDAREGRLVDPEREIAIEDAERLRDALQRGHERVFSVSLYLLVRAATRQELDERRAGGSAARWHAGPLAPAALGAGARLPKLPARGTRSAGGHTQPGHERARRDPAVCWFVADYGARDAVRRLGSLPGAGRFLDPFDQLLDNANMVVAAPAGSGKSFFVKLMAMRNLCAGTDFVVIDPEDEYRAVAAARVGR